MFETWLPDDVSRKLKSKEPILVVDVREPDEWESGHIPQAKHIPLGDLPVRKSELDPKAETVIVCRSGARSTRACEFLAAHGYKVVNMMGGMSQWKGDLS